MTASGMTLPDEPVNVPAGVVRPLLAPPGRDDVSSPGPDDVALVVDEVATPTAIDRRGLPFVLPSATLTAFLLLIVAVLAFTVIYHPGIYSVVTGHAGGSVALGNQCLRDAMTRIGGTDAAVALWTSGQHVPGADVCQRTNGFFDQTAGVLLAFVMLFVATALQYWLGSTRRARRRGVVSITAERFPELHHDLVGLSDQATPGKGVRFLLDVLDTRASGVAFGRIQRRHILLGRGVLALRSQDPEAFQALVLHELAHMRNRDLDVTIITLSFARAYLVLVLAPVVLATLVQLAFGVDWQLGLTVIGQLAGMAALLVLARGAVLRNREYQADARVVQWQNMIGPLRRILLANEANSRGAVRMRGVVRGRVCDLVRRLGIVHPTPRSRILALEDPAPLMSPGFGFSFILGVCLVLTWDPSASPPAQIGVGLVFEFWPPEPFTVVLVALLGLTVLRAALYAATAGLPLRLMALRRGLAVGVASGTVLAPSIIGTPMMLPGVTVGIQGTFALMLAVMAWLLVLWLEFLAGAWTRAIVRTRHSWLLAFIPIAAGAVVVLTCARPLFVLHLDYLFAAHDMTLPLHRLPGPLLVVTLANSIAVNEYLGHVPWLLGGVALLVLPAVVGGVLGRRAGGPWPHSLNQQLVRRPALWGVCAAIVTFLAVALSIDWYIRLLSGEPTELLGSGTLLAAVCAATGAARAVRPRRHPVLLAMVDAAVVGTSLGVFLSDTVLTFSQVVWFLAYGLETALAAVLIVRALSEGVRALRAVS